LLTVAMIGTLRRREETKWVFPLTVAMTRNL